MIKKKSLISLVLAICLIVPAMFMLTACGGNNKEVRTTVTADEWASALSFEGMDNYSCKFGSPANADFLYLVERDGTKVHIKQVGAPASGNDVDDNYYDKITTGDKTDYKKYHYTQGEDKWEESAIDADAYTNALNNLSSGLTMFKYDNFKYNEKTKSYEADNLTAGKTTITNLSVQFADGLITKASFFADGVETNYVFSYGSVRLTIPSVV